MSIPLWRAAGVGNVARRLASAFQMPMRVARLLAARGYEDPDEVRRLLAADVPWSHPLDFTDMRAACEQILQAVRKREIIAVIGDYDVDGVSAAVIATSAIQALGGRVTCHIPDRVSDGYGFSLRLLEAAKSEGASLILTVDNGIRAVEAISAAVADGLRVVVTDHHEPGDETLPDGVPVLHFTRHRDPGSAKRGCGAFVAWKLAVQLLDAAGLGKMDALRRWLMGLAALGTLADMMPLVGENRRLVREGIRVLATEGSTGWRVLCDSARVRGDALRASDVSWRLVPRLNAAGRMAHADLAYRLLMAEDDEEAKRLVDEMEVLNAKRQEAVEAAFAEAVEAVERDHGPNPAAIVVAGDWPLGVVGLVAGRLAQTYACPAIALARMGDGTLRGSGRAPEDASMLELLHRCAEFLHRYGGHDAAVGCELDASQLPALRAALMEAAVAARAMGKTVDPPAVIADDYLGLSEPADEILLWLERLAPFGPEHEPFRFFVGPVEIVRCARMGSGEHLRLTLAEGDAHQEAVWFRAPDGIARDTSGLWAFIVELVANAWRGTVRPQLRIERGYRLPRAVSREAFAAVFRALRRGPCTLETLRQRVRGISADLDRDLESVVATFVELGFAAQEGGLYHVIASEKRDLRDSLAYQAFVRRHLQPVGGGPGERTEEERTS
ncbi:single-stranded-DNA-specific exonuclease RecJ [Alicyclobacillus acidocaldarius]|uniref:Single-stranded-DNA-specific exonuclease RecJ n=1 Tax=Alicyclobacillus acidocaldarius (strain Tc-4-1) TaxID=1048834 RepID=F8IFN9_ALIAT|nr:single-stranded-DNA-specific exonuclease RecJ [Alicyclobacillus acidocaldarius]AEJ44123.1 single-stranded-DNA-specific exonuclease RecJ [Alicyclobacillus acidocaldarius subsp. acidocaldarius Tc-4-1]